MDNYIWTRHSEWKMREYGLSQQRIKRVIRNPDRVEKSIVPGMIAAMQIGGTSKHRVEIWTMYEIKSRGAGSEKREKTEGVFSNLSTESAGFPKVGNWKSQSPAQKFREQRQQEFLKKKNGELGGSFGNSAKSIRVISAWKYPGESPERDPIPFEILEELRRLR